MTKLENAIEKQTPLFQQ